MTTRLIDSNFPYKEHSGEIISMLLLDPSIATADLKAFRGGCLAGIAYI